MREMMSLGVVRSEHSKCSCRKNLRLRPSGLKSKEKRTSPRMAITTPVTMGSLKSLIIIRVVESSRTIGSPSCESGPWRLFFGRNWV